MAALAPQLHSLVYALPTTWGLGLIIGSALRLYRVHVFSWFTGHGLRRVDQTDVRAQPLQREADRGDIPRAVGEEGDLAHNTPLVLGTVSPSMRMACRRARPKAL